MGLIATAARNLTTRPPAPGNPVTVATQPWQANQPAMGADYASYARDGYQKNEIIFSAIDLRATSMAEPRIKGKRTAKEAVKTRLRNMLINHGLSALDADYHIHNLEEKVEDHPAIALLNKPNQFMTRFDLISTTLMHRDIGGNAYWWLGRGVGGGGKPTEIWPLRPDRVKVLPGGAFKKGYRYTIGNMSVDLPLEDVIMFKERHAYNDFYGMPRMLPISGRVNIDEYQKSFVSSFFQNAGIPSGVLTLKSSIQEGSEDEIRDRFTNKFSGPGGWFKLMILDGVETSNYTPLTMSMGARGLAIPDLDKMSEARLAMPWGIPGSILGTLIGYESSSYANKKQDWQVFWDITMTPIFIDFGERLTLDFLPEFGGLDSLFFDLGDIRALQEDKAAIHDRALKDYDGGVASFEESRSIIGLSPTPTDGDHFNIPSRATVLVWPFPDIIGTAAPQPDPVDPNDPQPAAPKHLPSPKQNVLAEARCWQCKERGRPARGTLLGENLNIGSSVYCSNCRQLVEVRE